MSEPTSRRSPRATDAETPAARPSRAARSTAKRGAYAEGGEDDDVEEGDVVRGDGDEEELDAKPARQKAKAASTAKKPRKSSKVVEEEEEDDDDDAGPDAADADADADAAGEEATGRGASRGRSARGKAATTPTTTSTTSVKIPTESHAQDIRRFSAERPLKLDARAKGRAVGGPPAPPKYEDTSETLDAVIRLLPKEADFERAVGTAMRVVLAHQSSRKKVTGSDIREAALPNMSEKDVKQILPAIRVHAAKRFRDIFGFDLVAGEDPAAPLRLSDPWILLNGLRSDAVNLSLTETATDADKVHRAVLMIALGIMLMNDGRMREDALTEELGKYRLRTEKKSLAHEAVVGGAKTVAEYLKDWTKEGYLRRSKITAANTADQAGGKEFAYEFGDKALNEIGKRAIVQFLSSAAEVELSEMDERLLLGMRADEV